MKQVAESLLSLPRVFRNPAGMKWRLILGALVVMSSVIGSRADETPLAGAMKNSLVSVQGHGVHNFDATALAGTKYFGIYYSASWCPPCQLFTPKLVEFYHRVKPLHPEFEVVFISSDYSQLEMEAYMKKDAMPWPALAFAKKNMKKALTQYAGPGIPCLVLVDAAGKVLSDSYVGTNYVGPNKVLRDIEATLQSEPAAASIPAAAGAASPSAPPAAVGKGSSNFDDFFKKK